MLTSPFMCAESDRALIRLSLAFDIGRGDGEGEEEGRDKERGTQ